MKKAFTLVELLVVIAVIAILAAMLLPVLAKSKDKARTTNCLSNEKQLNACFHLYVSDNADRLPPNNYVEGVSTTNTLGLITSADSWCPDDPRNDTSPANLQTGALWPYNTSLGIYHCPADRSTLTGSSELRWRSYNMSQSINGSQSQELTDDGITSYSRYTSVLRPSAKMVFIDENADTEYDAQFGFITQDLTIWYGVAWLDQPSDRHNQGGCLSFVDGHVERWRWVTRKVFYQFVQPVPAEEMPDWQRLDDAIEVE
jgi:prepilin-type N-terminal cleavage/methylation domain-containing protein/prepilin-type processing-associated H-X9-DG protein